MTWTYLLLPAAKADLECGSPVHRPTRHRGWKRRKPRPALPFALRAESFPRAAPGPRAVSLGPIAASALSQLPFPLPGCSSRGLDEGTRLLVLGPSPPQRPRDPTVQEEALTQAQILLLHHPRPCCAKEKGGLSDGFCARPGTLWRRKSREVALAQAASPHRGVLAPPLTSKDLGLEHSGGAAAELPGGRDPLSGLPRRSQQEAGLEVT